MFLGRGLVFDVHSHAYYGSITVTNCTQPDSTASKGKKRLTVCLKWHITKTIKGPGPYATRCKHEAMFVIILLGNNDIAGKTSRAWCVAMFSFSLFFEVLVSVP